MTFGPSVLFEFLPVLVFTLVVLVAGRLFDWPAAHLPLPILGWANKMTWVLEERDYNWEPRPSLQFFISPLLEGVMVLAVVLACIACAAAIQRPGPAGRVASFCWLSALLEVSTVVVDWAFVMFLHS